MSATAFVADIHGNVWALSAVLADIRRRGITQIFNLGDSLYGPLAPAETADRLMEAGIPSLRGNQDRILLDRIPQDASATLRYTAARLRPEHFEWLRAQLCTIEIGGFYLCHGTPASDDEYLLEHVTASGVELRAATEIDKCLIAVTQQAVLCGHSHVPRVVALSSGKVVVNPGSVGLPAYSDDIPHPHRMQAGSNHARYAVIDNACIELIAVPYDYRPAAARARENGREDWAIAIETGFAAK